MEEELKASIIEVGQMASALGLMGLLLAVPAGLLSDRIGRRVPTALGALIWGIALANIAVASEPYQVILSYALAGVGTVLFDASLTAFVGDISPPHELGRSYGIYNAAIQVGFAAGPAAGAFLILQSGYRDVFLTVAILPLIAGAMVFASRPRNHSEPADNSSDSLAEPVKMYRSRILWTGWISIFSLGVLLAGISVLAPLYARFSGFGEIFIGILFTIQSLTGAFGRFPFGRLIDTSRHVWLLTAGGLLLAGLSTAGFGLSASGIWLILMMGVFGVGLALAFMSASVGIARGTSVTNRGMAMGLGSMSRFAGFMFGPWLGSVVVSAQSAIGVGYAYGFFALASVAFIGILLILAVGWLFGGTEIFGDVGASEIVDDGSVDQQPDNGGDA